MAKKGQKFMEYDNDFREKVVLDYLNSNLGYKKIAEKYFIESWKTVETWVRKYTSIGTTDNQKVKNSEINYQKRYEILKKYGHTINKIYPALIPLTVKESFIKNLQGISMKNVEISCKIKKKKISQVGDMLFAHFGLTGPAVLKFSSYINKYIDENELEISLDFLPSINSDEISKLIRENPNKNVINNLKGLLPQNFLKEIFNLLDLTDKKANELSKSDELKIVECIKSMKLTCNGSIGIKASQVTSGGVSVKEINSSTMESKLIENLFFTGEVIDVDAETGGYNLQIAFSTGYLAGISV